MGGDFAGVVKAIKEAKAKEGRMGCKHDWALQSDTVLPSAIEQMGAVNHIKGFAKEPFQKKHIVILTCEICGKIDKTITALFEGMD